MPCFVEFNRQRKGPRSNLFKHGHAGYRDSPEYVAWLAMKQRCFYRRGKSYKDYGARGITVSPEWLGDGGFERFLSHIGPKPTKSHTIERIRNDGNYEPGNVKWATRMEQSCNKRPNKSETHCRRGGHEFTPENTIWELGKYRRCRICRDASRDKYRTNQNNSQSQPERN
jgi:hypothetical protein